MEGEKGSLLFCPVCFDLENKQNLSPNTRHLLLSLDVLCGGRRCSEMNNVGASTFAVFCTRLATF